MAWFKGHFPEQPVLPGIVQVHLAALWASHLWGWKPLDSNLSQLKFRQILRPMDTVRLLLTRDIAKQRLAFAYKLGDTVASQGMIGGAS
jgi:3-hydroxymyristoyl/3-hydroxydecanoyl-(acyl carrier protein) dehydratase